MHPSIKLVSFDVWNTLLRLDIMFNSITRGIGSVLEKDVRTVEERILETYREIKSLWMFGEVDDWEVLEESQSILAEKLGSTVDDIKRGITRGIAALDLSRLPFPEVPKILTDLSRNFQSLCIIGNVTLWPGCYTRLIIEKLGLSKFFKAQLYSDELGVSKPDRRIFAEACRLCGVECAEAIHVGDNPKEDIGGALSAGMKAAYLVRSIQESRIVKELGLAIIPDLSSLPKAIELLTPD